MTKSTNFNLERTEPSAGSWLVSPVDYRQSRTRVFGLGMDLLPERTQDEHARRSIEAAETNEFATADMSLYHAIFTTLYRNKDSRFKTYI